MTEQKEDSAQTHLERMVICVCGWIGRAGDLIAKDKLRCPRCDSDKVSYQIAEPPERYQ